MNKQDQHYAVLSVGRDYEVEHRDGKGVVQKAEGELISLDEQGFVVLEKNGKRIIIRKDLIDIMREQEKG